MKTSWRQRVFPVVGVTVSVITLLFQVFVVRRLSTGYAVAAFVLYIAVVIGFAHCLWRITRRVGCPRCGFDHARLVYDWKRDEFIACPRCNHREATGGSLPND